MTRLRRASTGFTLIELVMIILVLSLVSAGLVKVIGQMSGGLIFSSDSQVALELAQECGEYLIGLRRHVGYTMNGTSNCNTLPLFATNPLPPQVVVSDPYTDGGVACPVAANCKKFEITANYASARAKTSVLIIEY